MSNILISGCGISFSGQKPTWVKVLKLCGVTIIDRSGPAISNQLIINNIIEYVHENNDVSHVICQLTSMGKLDVKIHEGNKELYETDSLRNFVHNGYWPSSKSDEHEAKKLYYKFLYSPCTEETDTVIKLLYLQDLCKEKQIKLCIVQGYHIDWTHKLAEQLHFEKKTNIHDDYVASEYYKDHDFTNHNTVPDMRYQIHLAKKFNKEFLKLNIDHKLDRFHE